MSEREYELIGYINRHPGKDFTFIIPVFALDEVHYRCDIDDGTSRISSFDPVNSKYFIELSSRSESVTRSEGQEALYMFQFKGEIFKGNKVEIGIELLRLIRYGELNSLERYDIYFFLAIPQKVNDSVNEILKEFRSYGLERENFVKPIEVLLDIKHFSDCLLDYSLLLEHSPRVLDYQNYYSEYERGGDTFQFNKFHVFIHELQSKFRQLILARNSDVYRDLVVHSFLKCNLHSFIEEEPQFKFRKLVPIGPVSEKTINENQSIAKNTQSSVRTDLNAMEISMTVEKNLAQRKEAERLSPTDDELLEMKNTQLLAAIIKKQFNERS